MEIKCERENEDETHAHTPNGVTLNDSNGRVPWWRHWWLDYNRYLIRNLIHSISSSI